MHKEALQPFEEILFSDEQLPLFYSLLRTEREDLEDKKITLLEVFKFIFNNTQKNPDSPGLTKEMIRESLNLSRKVCDDLVSMLEGATLIQYTDPHRFIYWTSTSRALQLAIYISKDNKRG